MSIRRVWGLVDCIEVTLYETSPGEYAVKVPLDRDGEYVVEIFAENHAGNQAHIAKLLYTVEAGSVTIQCLKQEPYRFIRSDKKPVFTLVYPRKEGCRDDYIYSGRRSACSI